MYDPNAFYTPPQPEYYPRYPAPPAPAKTRSPSRRRIMIGSRRRQNGNPGSSGPAAVRKGKQCRAMDAAGPSPRLF